LAGRVSGQNTRIISFLLPLILWVPPGKRLVDLWVGQGRIVRIAIGITLHVKRHMPLGSDQKRKRFTSLGSSQSSQMSLEIMSGKQISGWTFRKKWVTCGLGSNAVISGSIHSVKLSKMKGKHYIGLERTLVPSFTKSGPCRDWKIRQNLFGPKL